jgi:hypothetical protein
MAGIPLLLRHPYAAPFKLRAQAAMSRDPRGESQEGNLRVDRKPANIPPTRRHSFTGMKIGAPLSLDQ